MMMWSVELYRTLGDEVGLETDGRRSARSGSPRRASASRSSTRQAGWAKTFGLPLELISAAGGAAPLPADDDRRRARGRLPPDRRLHRPLAAHASRSPRAPGAAAPRSYRTRASPAIQVERGRVRASSPTAATIETEVVVNAGGMFAKEIGALAGVNVPVVPMAHEYLVTKPSGLPLDMPTMRDPSLLVYFRPESGGLIMGGYERHPAPWALDGIPPDFNGKLLARGLAALRGAAGERPRRVPSLEEMEVVQADQRAGGVHSRTASSSSVRPRCAASGPRPASAPTGSPGAGGIGRLVAEWIVDGVPSLDAWQMDSRRFGRRTARSTTRSHARVEVYETYYDVKYPGHERQAGRPLRLSPAYARLAELGAVFGEKSGWERANWFEPNAARGDESLRPRAGPGRLWSPAIGAEHRACRETAALFDETSFAKIDVTRRGRCGVPRAACARTASPATSERSPTRQMLNRARRDRVRLHRLAARRGSVPDRHRDRVRPARPRVDPRARAATASPSTT